MSSLAPGLNVVLSLPFPRAQSAALHSVLRALPLGPSLAHFLLGWLPSVWSARSLPLSQFVGKPQL